MPIIHSAELSRINQGNFSKIDYVVMGAAFAAHNQLGRLFDEIHYAQYIEDLLAQKGYNIEREYKISLVYEDFKKDYFIDLLVNHSVPYELKTTTELNDKHHAQTLNYLYLSDLSHGKLINFRTPSVESRFVSTSLTSKERLNYTIEKSSWNECSDPGIETILEELLNDWGTHLSLEAYREGLSHFCSSDVLSNKPLSLHTESGYNGQIILNRIDENSFLYVTSTSKHLKDHQTHITKILKMTDQKQAQWIHFDKSNIQLKSVFPQTRQS